MSERDYFDEGSLQSYKKSLINRRNSLSPITDQAYIKLLDQMIAELPEHFGEESVEHKKMVEEYLQKELGKRQLKNFLIPIVWPFIVLFLIIGLGAINIKLMAFLFWAIMIGPLGFLILFFLLQWIIGKKIMNRYPKLIFFAILTILVVLCIVLTSLNIL